MTDLPDPLAALAEHLRREGFERRERPPDRESFGDQVVALGGEGLDVTLIRDRGEWSIELAHPSWSERYDPDIWRAALEGTDPMEPSPLADQAGWVAEQLDELRRAAADPALPDRLDEIATARAELWFG